GFLGPIRGGILSQLSLELDARGNVKSDKTFMTSVPGIFSAGDVHRGQSLVVWAIAEGRQAAHHIDKYLMGSTQLPL
ncbi:MAG: FAD-dependent oxidoreductase, partial [Terriglobia bacterium]